MDASAAENIKIIAKKSVLLPFAGDYMQNFACIKYLTFSRRMIELHWLKLLS